MRVIERNGFSFIQILIILTLIAIFAWGFIYIIKPGKVLEKSRDAARFDDLQSLSGAINQYLADGHNFDGLVGPYSSIDLGFANDKARQQIDGQGWIPLNFTLISTGAPFNLLPIDPLNNSNYNYRLGVSQSNKTYEIDCLFEYPENTAKYLTDNGNNPNAYEVGSDLTIL